MNKKILFSTLLLSGTLVASAHTVLLDVNFDRAADGSFVDYKESFPTILECDNLPPMQTVGPLFMDADGVAQPWWHLRDVSTSTNEFIASHSCYMKGGQSNDWFGSIPITIPTKGFNLEFDAQSGTVFAGEAILSDLWLFITETPIAKGNLPQQPTKVYTNVPDGKDPAVFEDDFTHYEFNLDDYVGKTIYINFANLNKDRHLLALDNIRVIRLDDAGMSISYPEYSVGGETFDINVSVTNTADKELKDLSLVLVDGVSEESTTEIPSLAIGETKEFTLTGTVEADKDNNFTVTLKSEGMIDIVEGGLVKGISHKPHRRVMFEEATGAWCGNCPIGSYTIENMMLDDEMKEIVAPVSVHIPQSANNITPLVNEEYYYMLGLNSAPSARMDRGKSAIYFSTEHDANFDKTNPKSVAYSILSKSKEIALFDVKVSGEFMSNGKKINKIAAKAEITPVRSTDENVKYAVGFIVTENNVNLTGAPAFVQSNYYSGMPYDSELGGFSLLPSHVDNMRFQDVAREIYGFNGYDNSLPVEMKMGETYTFERELPLPETYRVDANGKCTSPEIVTDNLSLIAFVITTESHDIMNCDMIPMSEQTENRFTIRQVLEEYRNSQNGVESVEFDENAAPEYFTLDGVKVSEPTDKGIYIVRRGGKVTKEIIK